MILIEDKAKIRAIMKKVNSVELSRFSPSYRALAPMEENYFLTKINDVYIKVYCDKIVIKGNVDFEEKEYVVANKQAPKINHKFNSLMDWHINNKAQGEELDKLLHRLLS